jgi:signal transduction histidine kinase/ActR/RegA family two-component response regulator
LFPSPLDGPSNPRYWDSIFDVIPFPVYIAEFGTFELVCANRAMHKRVEITPGAKCFEAIYRQDKPCLFCRMPDLADADPSGDSFVVFEHFNDLDDCWYQVRESVITWFDGRRVKYSIAVDIGALKEVQNALVEAHAELAIKTRDLNTALVRAGEAERAKSEFLATMSHEIRTPMNSIIGMVRLLADRPLEPEDREKLDIIGESGDALLAIINDILDLSRLDAGGMVFEIAPFDLIHVVNGVALLLRGKAGEKGLALDVVLAPDLPPWVLGDSGRLRQVLVNLVGNAVKFTESGRIRLEAAPCTLADGRVGVEFLVADTGIGMTADQLARLFEPFSQADASISRRFGGSGLGLAICKRLAEGQGGEIGADSMPGVGSRFRLRLPLAATQPVEKKDTAALSGRVRPLNILMAEDNPFNQRVALGLLQRDGHRVTVVNDGAEAVEAVQQATFDVILMDMQMPNVDGTEAARRIRALPGPLARLPIIALTANALPADAARCKAAGMDSHVAKPIAPEALRAALAEVCGSPQDGAITPWDEVRELMGGAQASELAAIFVACADKLCDYLASAADTDGILKAVHELRGVAAYAETPALAETAQDMARAVTAADAARLAQLQRQLSAQWRDIRAQVVARFTLPA